MLRWGQLLRLLVVGSVPVVLLQLVQMGVLLMQAPAWNIKTSLSEAQTLSP